jgi:farnesyl-diphosphate farnesyltransferase
MLPRRSHARPDLELQKTLLGRVSRTFALTIPLLPDRLERVVGNAYLLCRVADTVEDAAELDAAESVAFYEWLLRVVDGQENPHEFSTALLHRLRESATADERWLIRELPSLLAITDELRPLEQAAVRDCLRVMARGMAAFYRRQGLAGLATLSDYSAYCYVVAGVVGEMLTRLFLFHVSELHLRRRELQSLAASFGLGLQMTNILKDTWEDRARGVCWLPRDVFAEEGLEVRDLHPRMRDPRFARAWWRLVGVARGHLEDALSYTLALPPRETGLRNFCLWALFMAAFTLRNLHRRPDFASGAEVKIDRQTLLLIIGYSRLAARSDRALRAAFDLAVAELPQPMPHDQRSLVPAPGANLPGLE